MGQNIFAGLMFFVMAAAGILGWWMENGGKNKQNKDIKSDRNREDIER